MRVMRFPISVSSSSSPHASLYVNVVVWVCFNLNGRPENIFCVKLFMSLDMKRK